MLTHTSRPDNSDHLCMSMYICMYACMHVHIIVLTHTSRPHNSDQNIFNRCYLFWYKNKISKTPLNFWVIGYWYVHIYIQIHMHTWILLSHWVSVHTYLHTNTHAYMNTFESLGIGTYISTYKYTCIHESCWTLSHWVHTYVHTNTHAYIHKWNASIFVLNFEQLQYGKYIYRICNMVHTYTV